jgi:hypothetical protein
MTIVKNFSVRTPNAETVAALGVAAPVTTHSSSNLEMSDFFKTGPTYTHATDGLMSAGAPNKLGASSDDFDTLVRNALSR